MNNFKIKSKVYCNESKKMYYVCILINIAVIIMAVCSIISIFFAGINVGNISACVVAVLVGATCKPKNMTGGHYEICVLSISVEETKISIDYLPNFNKRIVVNTDKIKTLEYSDQLQCLRIVCDYNEMADSEEHFFGDSEVLLYIPYNENQQFYYEIENVSQKRLMFVDR